MKKRNLVIIILSFAIFNCCTLGNQKNDLGLNKIDSITVIDTNYSPGFPEITTIPYPKINPDTIESELIDYLGRFPNRSHVEFFDFKTQKFTKYYRLPEIKNLKHIIIDSSFEVFSCPDNISLDSLLHFKKYQIRFPPIGKYELFYVCDWDFHDTVVYLNSLEIQKYCKDFGFNHSAWYGFLIIYNPVTSQASVIELFNTFHACASRRFYITADYKIEIFEIDRPQNWRLPLGKILKKYQVLILENGEINIEAIRINR